MTERLQQRLFDVLDEAGFDELTEREMALELVTVAWITLSHGPASDVTQAHAMDLLSKACRVLGDTHEEAAA